MSNTKTPIRLVGSKSRIAKKILEHMKGLGGEVFIDVFGGSGAMTAAAGEHYHKLIYNDIDEDLWTFYSVLRNDQERRQLFRILQTMPMSRQGFRELSQIYEASNFSFSRMPRVERAAAIFYRSAFCYGGKISTGGFSCSASDRTFIKERASYHGRLRLLGRFAQFWKLVTLESLSFDQLIGVYSRRDNTVFYCDPPYFGTESYYSRGFG